MRIALASILLTSVLAVPAPAFAATPGSAVAVVSATPALFSPCTLFPFLPWCPK